jgi:hypothetical protein
MSRIAIGHLGKLSVAPAADAPLLVVFGGKTVGRTSGQYMWDYMPPIASRFHIFVAASQKVDGVAAYKALIAKLAGLATPVTPSKEKQILYLFSGGWAPGMQVLKQYGAANFSAIFLVDIWMGDSSPADFYKKLADTDAAKLTYVHTSGGAVNDKARDYIVKKLGASRAPLVKGGPHDDGMAVHMSTNKVAVARL